MRANKNYRFIVRCISLLSLLVATASARCEALKQWYTLSIDGERVGYAWRVSQDEPSGHTHVEHVRIEISQFRRRATIDRHLEIARDSSGRPHHISLSSKAGADQGAWRGTFDTLTSLSVATANSVHSVKLPQSLVLPDHLLPALANLAQSRSAETTLQYLDPARAAVAELHAAVTGSDDESVKVETTLTETGSPHRETLWLDHQGRLVRQEQPFFGATLVWTPCKTECQKAIEHPFDPMTRLTVRSPFRIPAAAAKGTIRYVIARADGVPATLVNTGEQQVVRNGPRSVVTVCARCGAHEQTSDDALQTYLASNPWIQSDEPTIRSFARRATHARDVSFRMEQLTQAVRAHMTGPIDFLGYASALEAYRTRSGDCTEIAVLLAAVARASGVPTRIAIGLVYADRFSGKKDVFSPHAWVQAWDGTRWISYDAALDGFDATHIAIAVGNGDPRVFEDTFAQLQQWRIENAGAVKSR